MKIREVTRYLEDVAPLSSQEGYDNSGLIVGNHNDEVSAILISLDCIESIVDEAIEKGCNLIVSHHPIVFKGLKRLNGKNYVERTVLKAIRNNIAIYAIHTNLDNYRFGVNREMGERLNMKNIQVLKPSSDNLQKINVFVPSDYADKVASDMFEAGAGAIGDYDQCSFRTSGTGTYRPLQGSNPWEGKQGEQSQAGEVRLEMVVSSHRSGKVVRAMLNAHPYEEVAFDLVDLVNSNKDEGAGMIGELKNPVSANEILERIKSTFKCGVVRHTKLPNDKVQKVAWCGGSGSFLLGAAKDQGADVFITADFKYHEFFDAEDQILIADIGHYESEQFTSDLLQGLLTKKFPKFAVHLTEVNTNPVNYF